MTALDNACYEAPEFEREARIVSKPPDIDRGSTRVARAYSAAQYASLGLEMAIATLIGWWLGLKADAYFDTDPWLMLLGLLFGIAAGFRGLIRAGQQLQRDYRAADAAGDVDAAAAPAAKAAPGIDGRRDAKSPPVESNP